MFEAQPNRRKIRTEQFGERRFAAGVAGFNFPVKAPSAAARLACPLDQPAHGS